MGSIRRRLLLSSLLVLAVFLGATAVALDRAYRDSAENALRARLKTDIYALLSAAELRRGTLELPQDLPESRLEVPGSGRYAEVSASDGKVLWRSPSSVGLNLPFVRGLAPGRESWTRVRADGETLPAYSFRGRAGMQAAQRSSSRFPPPRAWTSWRPRSASSKPPSCRGWAAPPACCC